jgi:hypothetical protein
MRECIWNIPVRAVKRADARALSDLLDKIIWIGGTPAFDTPLAVAEFEEYFLTGPNSVTCYLAGDSNSGLFFEFQRIS